jgi:hypothetical protein
MQGPADAPHQSADAPLPEAASVFDAATALDTALDMVDPQPTLVERLVRHVLLPRELLPHIEINSIILPATLYPCLLPTVPQGGLTGLAGTVRRVGPGQGRGYRYGARHGGNRTSRSDGEELETGWAMTQAPRQSLARHMLAHVLRFHRGALARSERDAFARGVQCQGHTPCAGARALALRGSPSKVLMFLVTLSLPEGDRASFTEGQRWRCR